MGFSLGGIVGGALGALAGGPQGAMAGYSIGSSLGGGGKSGGGGLPYGGTAADPYSYLNIRIPGFDYPQGLEGNLVDMPTYPDLPQYDNPYSLPNPTMQGPTIGEEGARKSTNQSLALLMAALDPTNPLSRNLVDAERQQNRYSFLGSLNDMVKANRRQRSLGRTGFISPERMDEGIAGSLQRNAYEGDLAAQKTGRDLLTQLSGDLRSTASSYGDVGNMETGRRNDYYTQLLNYVNQKRNDYTTSLGIQRGDIQNLTDQKRQDVINALNLYKGNQATFQPAQKDYLAAQAGMQGVQSMGGQDILKNLLGGDFAKSIGLDKFKGFGGQDFTKGLSGVGDFLNGLKNLGVNFG